jgi:DNA-binding MarR family transcriptional regulator
MNDSEYELYGMRSDIERSVDTALDLLPVLARTLYAAISDLGHAYRLTTAQVKVLLQLSARGQMSVGEIATALGISMPAASELVDRLVEAGHLTRAACPEDRRRVLVAATPDSEQIAQRLRDVRRAQLRSALARLSADQRPSFIPVLEALVASLNEADVPSETGGDNAVRADRHARSFAAEIPERTTTLAGEASLSHANASARATRGPRQ